MSTSSSLASSGLWNVAKRRTASYAMLRSIYLLPVVSAYTLRVPTDLVYPSASRITRTMSSHEADSPRTTRILMGIFNNGCTRLPEVILARSMRCLGGRWTCLYVDSYSPISYISDSPHGLRIERIQKDSHPDHNGLFG